MVEISGLSEKIFSLLKGNGLQVKIFDETGSETTDPTAARRFFVVSPNIMVTVDEENKKVEFSKGKDVDDSVTGIQKNIRKLADQFMMNSQIKVFGKSIQPRDYAYQAKMKGAAMNENMTSPHNHHLVGQVIKMIKSFTSKNHQHHQPNGAAFHDICSNLGEEPEEVQPILNKLVQQGKVVAHPYKDYVIYSMAVDEAVYEGWQEEHAAKMKAMQDRMDMQSDKHNAQVERNYNRSHELNKIRAYGQYDPERISAMTGNKINKRGSGPAAPSAPGQKTPITPSSSIGKKFNTSKATDTSFRDIPVNESFSKMFGSIKTSQQTLENVRILVRHKTPVDENVRGSRS
ncbi:MAG: hypothetical protein ACHQ1D_04490, partial [Nitrososphaerales archaeon]